MNEYLKQRSSELQREQDSYNRWYASLSRNKRNDFEEYCRHYMTDEEYNANPPIIHKYDPLSVKDMEMITHLMEDKISVDEWITYKSPKTKDQMKRVARTLTLAIKLKKLKKQAQWILTTIS